MKIVKPIIIFFFLFLTTTSCKEEPAQSLISNINLNDFINITTKLPEWDMVNSEVDEEYKPIFIKDCDIYDPINEKTWLYNVMLPPSFDENICYPVLYLLHGRTGHYYNWDRSFDIENILSYYYSKGLQHMIIVMPDASDTYYVDDYLDDIKYESFFHKIFLPEIERLYPISQSYDQRWIAGLSMGGYGAALYSIKYPDLFSFCYAISAPLDGNRREKSPGVFNFLPKGSNVKLPYFIFDVGIDDSFAGINVEAHLALTILSIPHELILREGKHEEKYWKEALLILFERLSEDTK